MLAHGGTVHRHPGPGALVHWHMSMWRGCVGVWARWQWVCGHQGECVGMWRLGEALMLFWAGLQFSILAVQHAAAEEVRGGGVRVDVARGLEEVTCPKRPRIICRVLWLRSVWDPPF
jgi:hypothetical protein